MSPLLYILFFCSGISGLIYQVIWVRQFGQIFGNTVHSASMVVAIFMLGLGAGGYVLGAWADRRHQTGDARLLQAYATLEGVIAALGLAISLLLPHLGGVVAALSSYAIDGRGWQVLSVTSYLARAVVAVVTLGPITMLMGGTLTVLARHVVHSGRGTGWAIALLYGINTLGAALGAFVTDFALVPAIGLQNTQLVAVALNAAAAAGAWGLSRIVRAAPAPSATTGRRSAHAERSSRAASRAPADEERRTSLTWTSAALAMSGFAALGIEILWLRHLGVMLGGFRSVFSLLLTVMLLALGAGALAGGWMERRWGRPGGSLIWVQGLFAATTLLGLAMADAQAIAEAGLRAAANLGALSPSSRVLTELWFDLQPMLLEVALPSLVAGCAFPLANALVQRSEQAIGRRAGALYAANTAGAVCGSLLTGYVLLPQLGMQGAAVVLAAIAALAIVPLYFSAQDADERMRPIWPIVPAVLAAGACIAWFLLPQDYLLQRALVRRDARERVLTMKEGQNELLAVVEIAGRGRGLLTNGHAMSSTARLDQRYMRALAHVPLLVMPRPERVLVIGFGVGNTTQAATLHPSVTRVDVADLSANILEHADYFADANHGVLTNPKVKVSLNDGRMHLQMADPGTYDLITLEPPPIAYAGVASLYSRDFYELARSRLRSGGYVSQWLPAYQVPVESSLAMVRAFVEVFPQAVLISGMQAELILLGTTGNKPEIDPARILDRLKAAPALAADLDAIELGTPRQLAATFVGAAETLTRATQGVPPVLDDRPIQEYGVMSTLSTGLTGVPGSLFDLSAAPSWCPRCYEDGKVAPIVAGLDLDFALLRQAYVTPVAAASATAGRAFGDRRLLGSAYLGAVVPDTAEVHNVLGIAALRTGNADEGMREFEAALARDPSSANARANLSQLRVDQASILMDEKRYAEAIQLLRSAVQLDPNDPRAQNDLGVALASTGDPATAIGYFQRAIALAPQFEEARRNLSAAQAAAR